MASAPLTAGPIPLYYQLQQRLRERIDTAEFGPGAVLPTEDQICYEYNVSRITVRRALDELRRQGLIERRRGVGSFVTQAPRGINSKLTGSLDEFLAVAGSLTTRCLSLRETDPPESVRELLEIDDADQALLMKSLGMLEEGPIGYFEIWFPLDIGRQLVGRELEGHVPIVRQVELAASVRITRAAQTIEPDRAGEDAARHLGIDADAPILHVRRVYYAGDRPIELVNVRYHPERYRYAIDFKG